MSNSTLPILPEFHYSESEHVEPGLLPVFRLFLVLQIILLITGQFFSLFLHEMRGELTKISTWYIVCLVALLGYLSWPWLRRTWGKFYVPVALVVAAILPILDQNMRVALRVDTLDPNLQSLYFSASGWRLITLLLVPLVLVAWQYDFRRVILFSIGTSLLDAVLIYGVLRTLNEGMSLWVMMPLARFPMFLLLGYIITRMMQVQRERRDFLTRANVQLTRYATTLEQLAVSRERNRLARELHDTMAHALSAVSVQLEAVDSAWEVAPEQARALLHKSLAQTRSGLTETRRALQALRASPLDDLGLALAVRNLAEASARRTGMALNLAVDTELTDLPPDVEQGIYRVAQEAVENVVKHANASQLDVTLTQEDGQVTLRIGDNGLGFDTAAASVNGHYGVRGMNERADVMGAQFAIQSQPGQGTEVRLVWREG